MSNQQPEIKPVKIGNRFVGPGHPVYIVAELSANHRQNFDEAVRLIHAAKEAGADAVKLQTYTPDTMTIDCDNENFRHGKGSLWEGKSLYELYKEAYMPWEWQPRLREVAKDIGLDLFSSAYDETSVGFLDEMDVPAIKISSFEIIDLPLIQYAAATNRPLIISTGMATVAEITEAVGAAREAGCRDLVLLKCTSTYPAPIEEMNLSTIPAMARAFNLPCGLSDHSKDDLAARIAVAMGAWMLEKHFTLSRENNSVDSRFSIEPQEFKAMVAAVRQVELMMGKEFSGPTVSEKESLSFRRSLYAVDDIENDAVLTTYNIRSIRPSGGLPSENLKALIGRRVRKTVAKGTPITLDLLK